MPAFGFILSAAKISLITRGKAWHPNSWYKILNRNDKVLGVESFGESAPGNQLLEHFGFTVENVVKMAKSLKAPIKN